MGAVNHTNSFSEKVPVNSPAKDVRKWWVDCFDSMAAGTIGSPGKISAKIPSYVSPLEKHEASTIFGSHNIITGAACIAWETPCFIY